VKISKTGNIFKKLWPFLRGILVATGAIAAVMILLAFTSAPFWIWYGIGVKKAGISRPPDFIVLLGGGGMPSESGLMRTWYAARVAENFPLARVIIALPGDPADSLSALNLMKAELVVRGISPERILLEDSGTNTRAQALNIYKGISNNEYRITNSELVQHSTFEIRHSKFNSSSVTRHSSILLVTSPEHLYRAVLAFQKVGFLKVDGMPAFEQAIESDITFNARKLGGRRYIPDVGGNITLRYQFWTQLNYEILVLREWAALGYYKLKGWI
jgi:uncharacterized SAM-binding protein YcdF (DUF218 family)